MWIGPWPCPAARTATAAGFEYALAVPGCVSIRETGATLRASLLTAAVRPPTTSQSAALQAGTIDGALVVRSRRPGDRFRPLGGPGTRTVQDALVDRKIPVDRRGDLPIVVDGGGRILWVPGVAIAHESRVTNPGAGMVILELDGKPKDNQ
jgi:tRNA(Ile)-lysidine synthetase-like protein